jgi:hypothetical protein
MFAADLPQSPNARDRWDIRVRAAKIAITTMRGYVSPNASSNAA